VVARPVRSCFGQTGRTVRIVRTRMTALADGTVAQSFQLGLGGGQLGVGSAPGAGVGLDHGTELQALRVSYLSLGCFDRILPGEGLLNQARVRGRPRALR
jgi:hypothetical protein